LTKIKERPLTATTQLLKKITLSLLAGSTPDTMNLAQSPVTMEFIYGVGSSGLCPFETVLHDKQQGENLTLSVSADEAGEYFGHLLLPLRQALGLQLMPATMHLRIEVSGVRDADDREVVQSLAKALAHGGCGGSCGCGC